MAATIYFKRRMLQVTLTAGCQLGLFNGPTEITGVGYARQSVTFVISATEPIQATNGTVVRFGTAGVDWGAVTHVGVFDPLGELCDLVSLVTPTTILAGGELVIPSRNLEVGFA